MEDPGQAERVAQEIEMRFPEVAMSQVSEFTDDVTDFQLTKASTWAIAATFVAAVSVALAGKPVEAVILGALVLVGLLALGTFLWDRRPKP